MKKTIFFLVAGIGMILAGCSQNTYSRLRDQEDRLIANYISRNNLTILTEEPNDDHKWGEKEYYKVRKYDNLYFHLIERGDSIRVDSISPERKDTVNQKILTNNVIIVRYKKFGLTEIADTMSYWTTLDQAYPMEFHLGNTSECDCVAWHVAVQLMKYPNSQCEVIVPSKLGFSEDQTTVTPYVYIMKIKVKQ